MAANVGPGVLARMIALGDHPLTDEQFQHSSAQVNARGYQWSKTWGMQGLYVASNASGNWECAGPFPGGSE